MKILIATPILYDSTSPFNHLFRDILTGFVENGNTVTRIVAAQTQEDRSYDLGVNGDGITYIPVLRNPAPHANIIRRYISDTLTAMKMARKIRRQKADVLFEDVCYSSFWTVRAAKKKGMRVVAMMQDVWPDNAVQSCLIGSGGLIYRYFEAWQKYVYRVADRIICISSDMKRFLASKGVDAGKIEVIYNWGYSDETVSIPWEENRFVRKYGLEKDKFYAVYAGNIGRMQNVELIVKTAEIMADDEKIRFLIVGSGVKENAIREMVEKLPNVTMLPMQPAELATSIYSAAGVNLIPLVPDGVKTALPSKTGVILSCGRPAIFAFGSSCEFSQTVNEFDAGECVDPQDPEMLRNAILKCEKSRELRYGAHAMFKALFTRSSGIQKYSEAVNR